MKKTILAAAFVLSTVIPTISQSAQVCFDPTTQGYDMNGESKLTLRGVTAFPNGLTADAKTSWHSELSLAIWYANLLKAQENAKQLGVGYDPNSGEIWFVGHMVSCTANDSL